MKGPYGVDAFAIQAVRFGLAGLLACVPGLLSAQGFVQITAEISQTNYANGTNATSHWSFPCSCIVGTNEWRIDDGYSLNGREAWYSDGTNAYNSLQILDNPPQQEAAAPAGKDSPARAGSWELSQSGTNRVTICIAPSPGGHPLGNLGANIPWLAFCSGTYLKREGRVIPLPVTDIHGNSDSLAYADKIEVFKDDYGLPKSVELVTSRSQYLNSLHDDRLYRNERLLQARLHLAEGAPDGTVRFRYEVVNSTNFNGWNFPTEFRYYDYRPGRGGNWRLAAAGIGKVASLQMAGRPQNVFKSDAPQMIVDLRFRHKTRLLDAITYTWTNAAVPATNDPALQARFAFMSSQAGAEHQGALPPVRVLLVLLFLAPVLPLLLKYVQQNSRKPTGGTPRENFNFADKST